MKSNIIFLCAGIALVAGGFFAYTYVKEKESGYNEVAVPGNTKHYTSNELEISFIYPNDLYLEEQTHNGKYSIMLTSLAPNDPEHNSSVGLMNAIVITGNKNTTLREVIAKATEQMPEGLIEEDFLVDGHEAHRISYIGAYSGETNYITFIQGKDGQVLEIRNTDTTWRIAKDLVDSIALQN